MQEASMSLQSLAVLLPYNETPITNAQRHRLSRLPTTPKSAARRRLLVINGASHGQEPSREIRLDKQDLMAIEFGRLLGEPKEKTIAKVLRRKIDPGSTYIGLEKEAKAGKELINKADFALKVERPSRASRNGSMLDRDIPHLASPPSRQNGSPVNLPKIGANADAHEILDDSLLHKPISSQHSKAVSPIMSSTSLATNIVKRPESQHMRAGEQSSVILETLRRPSLDKGQDDGKPSGIQSKENNLRSPSQSVPAEVAKDSDSMEASKLEFERLLDKAFNTSTANLASPPVRQSNLSRESTTQDRSRLMDAAAALPNLVSPPLRHRGSVGTFSQSAPARNMATRSSVKSLTSEALDESLLRKPGVQASPGFTLSSAQSNDEFHTAQDEQSLMVPKKNVQPDLNESSASPRLAARPSRHTGRMGTFVQPSRAKIRGIPSQSKEPVDNSIDESLIRKPTVLEKSTISMVSTPPTEASTTPLSINKLTQLKSETLDANILPRPLMEAFTSQIDDKRGYPVDGLEQDVSEETFQTSPQPEVPCVDQNHTSDSIPRSDSENFLQVSNGSNGKNEALDLASGQLSEPVLEVESSVQSYEQLAEQRVSAVDLGKGSNGLCTVAESGGPQDVNNSSGAKSVRVAALKRPVRVSSSNPGKGLASEGNSLPDSLQGLIVNSDVIHQASSLSAGEEDTLPSHLDSNKDSRKGEESVGSSSRLKQLIGDPNNVLDLAPDKASLGDQQGDQMVQEQLVAAPGSEQTKVRHDDTPFVSVSADKEEENGSFLLPSTNNLRRPSQDAHAEFSTRLSEHMDLQASHPKLHQAKEEEEKDWARAEALLKAKEQVEVKMIGCNSAGLFVSFGCLVGFLPSFELGPKRGLVDFGSWAQQKGYDLSQKKAVKDANDGGQSGTLAQNVEGDKLSKATEGDSKELKDKYKEEVSKLLSSFVGEKTKVIVKLVDKGGRKLKVSEKEADPGSREHLQKKANLMAELKLGDVVTCQVKSITPIGVFVEVDGVPALIHHSEVSWNTRTNPASLLSIGEVIKAKVCRLDRTLQRINLSLKQMQPDPLKRTLESVVGDLDTMQAVEASESMEMSWPELGDLIKKLEKMDHIACVSRGRCLHSAACAPSFQVLISTPQSNGYKLLARFENKIQEILVDTTLDSDKMKEYIRLCTFSEA